MASKDISGNRISSDSLWDDASRRFAQNASGEVRVIAPIGPNTGVYAQTELPELLKNSKVTSIVCIPLSQLQEMQTSKGLAAVQQFTFGHARLKVELGGFGANYTLTSPLPADLNGERLTLDATFSRDDIAWRYALRELNPFVIPDIAYDQHNTDGSLDLYDEKTGQGQNALHIAVQHR